MEPGGHRPQSEPDDEPVDDERAERNPSSSASAVKQQTKQRQGLK